MPNEDLSGLVLPVAQVSPATEAEGPGRRFALWLQGCPLRCPGCCNPEMLPFNGGRPVAVAQLLEEVLNASRTHGVEGITFLGGEPVAHAAGAALLASRIQQAGLSVMVFSGYTLAEIRGLRQPAADLLLAHTDILVDGRYDSRLPERRRRWVGSSNQEVHFLSSRYRVDDPAWRLPNTVEFRFAGGELLINGFPAAGASTLGKRR